MSSKLTSALRRAVFPLALAASLAPVSAWAALTTYGFANISNNLAGDAAIGEAQLFVDVTDEGVGANQTAFVFRNIGPLASSITDIYFDDGTLLGIASIINTPLLVDFSQGASPGDLPAGNNANPDFVATAGFTADSNPPTQPMGVNPGESLTIVFDLIAGQTYQDVIDALAQGFADATVAGSLRIGIHVQGFASGGSESFINDGGGGVEEVPEPGTTFLLGSGLLGLWAMRRRKTAV